jgi:diguanylate cyclase (GGDEF)-like protein
VRRVLVFALLGLGVAFVLLWLVGRTVDRSRDSASNSQLVADLQTARAGFQSEVASAGRKAAVVARAPAVGAALARGDEAALRLYTAQHPDTLLISRNGSRYGALAPLGVRRVVDVVSGGRTIGRVVADAPLDAAFLERAKQSFPQGSGDLLAVTRNGRVAAGPLPRGLALAHYLSVEGRRYVTLSSPLVVDEPALGIAALTPAPSRFLSSWRLPLAVLVTLVALGALALLAYYLLRDREREQPRPAPVAVVPEEPAPVNVDLLGEKLAEASDVEALLRVILDAAVKATGAAGGRIAYADEPVSRAGEAGREVLRVPVETSEPEVNAALLLFPPPSGFSPHAANVAHWLGAHATMAIRDAHVHRLEQEQETSDELTGLASRRQFTTRLQREFDRAEDVDKPLALLLSDVDAPGGTRAGEEALKRFAESLRRCLRDDVDFAARIGGEKFGVLLPETDADGAARVAQRLRSELLGEEGAPQPLTASYGISAYPRERSASELLLAADTSLRRAKQGGPDQIVVAGRSLQRKNSH